MWFLIFESGAACAAPLPTDMRAKRTVAVIESGNCEWGAKVGSLQFRPFDSFSILTLVRISVTLNNMEYLGRL
jgi:hypothetical protein